MGSKEILLYLIQSVLNVILFIFTKWSIRASLRRCIDYVCFLTYRCTQVWCFNISFHVREPCFKSAHYTIPSNRRVRGAMQCVCVRAPITTESPSTIVLEGKEKICVRIYKLGDGS